MVNRKSQVFVSAVLYLLITGIVMVLLLEAGIPVLEKARDKAIFDREQDQFLNLNQHIKDVASEGQGSKRIIPVQVEKGNLEVEGNSLKWSMLTDARIIEPRTHISFGDLKVVSEFDVSATEYNNSYIIENSYIRVNFSKCETDNNCTSVSDIINAISIKDGTLSSGDFSFYLSNSTFNGTGSTHLLKEGTLLDSSTVVVDLALNNYDLHFTLRSKEDFLIVEAIRN